MHIIHFRFAHFFFLSSSVLELTFRYGIYYQKTGSNLLPGDNSYGVLIMCFDPTSTDENYITTCFSWILEILRESRWLSRMTADIREFFLFAIYHLYDLNDFFFTSEQSVQDFIMTFDIHSVCNMLFSKH